MSRKISPDCVLESLRGATIKAPGLLSLFNQYPSGINEGLERLTEEVNKRIDSIYPNDPVRARRSKEHDFALFTAMWFPHAEFSKLTILAYYCLWIFLWDDEVDSNTGKRYNSMEETRRGHAESLSYVSHCLQLDNGYPRIIPTDRVTLGFKDIGDVLCKEFDKNQREAIFEYWYLYIKCVEEEQRMSMAGEWPSTDEYLATRRGSSGAQMTIAMIQYSASRQLPEKLRSHPAVRELHEQTNIVVSITNDILSLKKELKKGGMLSYIPVAYVKTNDLQRSTDEAMITIRMAMDKFALAKRELLLAARGMQFADDEVSWFIQGCEHQIRGNIDWK